MSSFEKKFYFAFIAIMDIAVVKVYIIVSLTDTIGLGCITRFENIFSTVASISLRLKTD